MSYILDALRKADAERERGHVPGIHAQPTFGGAAPPGSPRGGVPLAWIGVALGVLTLLLVIGWFVFRAAPGDAVTAQQPAAAPSTTAMLPAAAPASAALPPRTATAPADDDQPLPVIRQTLRPAPPAPAAKAGKEPATAASAADGAARVYATSELPEAIRRQLPTLTVGGSRYSDKASDRILIVNGQVFHEGDKIAPDLVLQQIRLKGAVLAFKGYRYLLPF
jgi:general secretion pathway protein B